MDKLIALAKSLYSHIPIGVLNLAAPLFYALPAERRYGNVFMETWAMLEEEEGFSASEQALHLNERFHSIVAHSIKHVPYYREWAARHNVDESAFTTIDSITKLPIINKEEVRRQGDRMLADDRDQRRVVIKETSGSTGLPLKLYFDESTAMREWANVLHLWKRAGYTWDSSRVVLRGAMFRAKQRGQLWQWDAMRRELSIDISQMDEKHCALYCRLLEKYKPDFIHGYPSAIDILCRYIEKHPLTHRFKGVLFVSENVTDSERRYVENILNAKSYSFYGHTERAAIAGECESSRSYHVVPSYGYIELVDENGAPIPPGQPGMGEMVVTGFTNSVMPLIRYRTGDLAEWDESSFCDCGRTELRIARVLGREGDCLVCKDGSRQSINTYRYEYYGRYGVQQFQFVQRVPGSARLDVVVSSGFNEPGLLRMLQEDASGMVDISINRCTAVKRGPNGKIKLVISQLEDGR